MYMYGTGDYAILLRSGIHWCTALFLNFLSSLTAVIGFFIGVAISAYSEQANGWILAFAAGLFTYIALVDLVSQNERCIAVDTRQQEIVSKVFSFTLSSVARDCPRRRRP